MRIGVPWMEEEVVGRQAGKLQKCEEDRRKPLELLMMGVLEIYPEAFFRDL